MFPPPLTHQSCSLREKVTLTLKIINISVYFDYKWTHDSDRFLCDMHLIITPENSSYRGEGNAGLVISLKKEEKVIRLEKQNASTEYEAANCLEEQHQKCENQIAMVKNVMKSLLGENLVNCPTLVFIHKDDIKTLNNLFSSLRPKYRIHRIVKEENSYVLMLPDYCTLPPDLKVYPSVGPVISVEIKMRTQVISSKSLYCPTDLFSGCPTRMLHALKMLFETPRNNLRIFKDQKLVFSEEKQDDLEDVLYDFFGETEVSYCDLFCNLVIEVLLKTLPGQVNEVVKLFHKENLQKCTNAYPDCSQNDPCHELPIGCVLYRILCLQMLDNLHIKNLHHLYLNTQKINKSLDFIGCYSISEIPPHLGEPYKMKTETDNEYASRKVWEFLIALTAQDCSIMLVLKKCIGNSANIPSQNVILGKDGNLYLFSIAVADLDAKALSKVEKRYKETPLILQACLGQPV